jgi:sporulation-control protein
MSIFKRIGASLGVGAATVETTLTNGEYAPGDTINGIVNVTGGSVEQKIEDIDLHLLTQYIVEKDDKKYYQTVKLGSYRVANGFTVSPKEKRQFTFSFTLPLDTPVTFGKTKVWVNTDVDIEMGVDAQDNDYIKVRPHPFTAAVLNAVEQIGFRLYQSDCEYAPRFQRRLPFVQEFEFVPATNSQYRSRLDEVEVICHPSNDGVEVYIQIDRKAKGIFGFLEEKMGTDESLVRVSFTRAELQAGSSSLTAKIQEIVNRFSR